MGAKPKKNQLPLKKEVVDLPKKEHVVDESQTIVTVIGTGTSHLKKDKEYHVHKILANTLIKKGGASYK